MKRAFIRLFGCILSAIGLSMSYDTTFTILLDDESAPGVAWATGSTGSGTGSSVPGTILDGFTGSCSHDSLNVSYEVYLSNSWYVGWLNLNYAGGVPYASWPTVCDGLYYFDLEFSGTSIEYAMQRGFASTRRGSGNYYEARAELDLCTGTYGYLMGMTTGLGDASSTCTSSWRNGCVMDTRSPSCTYSEYSYGAVYLPSTAGFNKMGCCYVSDSSYATGTGCKCFYGVADKSYTYTYVSNSRTNARITTGTAPFRDIFLDYKYNGCKKGFYPVKIYEDETQFVQSLMNDFILGSVNQGISAKNPCPTNYNTPHLNMTVNTSTSYFSNFWDNCDACSAMTSISNSSSFSPTITSNGTMQLTQSAAGVTGSSACRATVNGAKDATGTFNIVGSCSY